MTPAGMPTTSPIRSSGVSIVTAPMQPPPHPPMGPPGLVRPPVPPPQMMGGGENRLMSFFVVSFVLAPGSFSI